MSQELLRINLLCLGFIGLLLALCGFTLYFYQNAIASYTRYLLPLAPLAVASYVFVFNFFKENGGDLQKSIVTLYSEVFTAAILCTIFFWGLSLALITLVMVTMMVLKAR